MRAAVAMIAVVAATVAVSARRAVEHAQPGATELFAAYERGDHTRVLRTFADATDVVALRKAIERDGKAWSEAAGREAAPRRRLIAASVALELAASRMEDEWRVLRSIVEWGCRLVRNEPSSEAVNLWYLASVALGQGARDRALLFRDVPGSVETFGHLQHARSAVPDEPRLQLAGVWLAAGEPVLGERYLSDVDLASADVAGMFRLGNRRELDADIRRLETLAEIPAIRHEALVLAGFLQVARNRLEPAQSLFRDAAQEEAEPFVRYLAHFLLGRTFERQQRFDDADQAYRRALEAMPDVQSGALARGALMFASGRVDEGLALVNSSFAARPQPHDPWRLFGYGDFRRLFDYLERLRAELR